MNTSVSEVIRSRRTIQLFKPGEIPQREVILDAIDHAVLAPNHHGTQPWNFYLIGNDTKEKICLLNADLVKEKRGDKASEIKLKRWREVPGWLLLTCDNSDDAVRAREDYAACCCAAQNMMLYLWSQGIGVKWTTGDVVRDSRFYAVINIDSTRETVVGLFWYGYASELPQIRRSVKNKVTELT